MKDISKVSIVIPNLNSPTIGKTIKSIQQQRFETEFEIIVVGRDDNEYLSEKGCICFIETPKAVIPAIARNIGARQANGDILIFIDADCIAFPNWLSILVSEFVNPGVDVVGGGVQLRGGNYWMTSDNISMFHDYLDTHMPGLRKLLASINLAVRRDIFLRIGGFDETRPMGEDSDLSIRMRREGCKLHFQPKAVVCHFPARTRLLDMVLHHYRHGQYTIKLDPAYADEPGIPGPFRSKLGIFLASPVVALGSTISIFTHTPGLISYLHTVPAVFLSKLFWCFGAAVRRR